MYTLEGVSSVANFRTAYEESKWNRDSHYLICNVLFVSKGNVFVVYKYTMQQRTAVATCLLNRIGADPTVFRHCKNVIHKGLVEGIIKFNLLTNKFSKSESPIGSN